MLSLEKKNDLKPEVRKSRDPFYNMMYSLLTEKIERKKCPLFWPEITATGYFWQSVLIEGMGETCFHALSSGIPTSHSPGRLLASVKRIPLRTPTHNEESPTSLLNIILGLPELKSTGCVRRKGGFPEPCNPWAEEQQWCNVLSMWKDTDLDRNGSLVCHHLLCCCFVL